MGEQGSRVVRSKLFEDVAQQLPLEGEDSPFLGQADDFGLSRCECCLRVGCARGKMLRSLSRGSTGRGESRPASIGTLERYLRDWSGL